MDRLHDEVAAMGSGPCTASAAATFACDVVTICAGNWISDLCTWLSVRVLFALVAFQDSFALVPRTLSHPWREAAARQEA